MRVHLADTLALPLDLATQTLLTIGKRGSGKTNTAGLLVEQLMRAGVPCAVIDPADVWRGLKAAGTGPGLEVYVFGGAWADLPLEPGAGGLLADVVVDSRASVVMSVRHLSGGERARFVTDFCQQLLRRNQDPLHVVLEEAHEVAPQSPMPGEQVMLGAVKRLWKLGRSSGIGGTAVTQRPAALHKDITTQAEVLVVHRLIGPQDVAAVREWIRYHGQADSILPELAGLANGEAFVWGPEFPEGHPIGLRRVRIRMRQTYDAAATPKAGVKRAEPSSVRPVDLERLRKQMASTIERAEAQDPRRLQAKVNALQARLAAAERQKATPPAKPALDGKMVKLLSAAVDRLGKETARLDAVRDRLAQAQQVVAAAAGSLQLELSRLRLPSAGAGIACPTARPIDFGKPRPPGVQLVQQQLGVGERRVLTAVAQCGDRGAARETITVLTGYKRSSRDTYLQRLQAQGLVERQGDGFLATLGGVRALGTDFEPLPVGLALQDYWLARLPGGERAILELILKNPAGLERERIAELVPYKRSSRDSFLQRLSARRVIVCTGRLVRPAPDLLA